MEQITVPFNKKAKARSLHAFFNKQDRCWYIPENADETIANSLRNLAKEEYEETNEIGKTNEVNEYVENQTCECVAVQESTKIPNKTAVWSWDTVFEERNSLKIALTIQEIGMPENEEQRVKVLKILSARRPEEYPVTYDGMIWCSKEFAETYPQERVGQLAQKCIKGARPYVEEIRDSDLTEEEKALLMFVLPFES